MPITTLLLDADGVLQHLPIGWFQGVLRMTGAPDWRAVSRVEVPMIVGGVNEVDAFAAGFPDRTAGVDEILHYWNNAVVDAVALELVTAVRAAGVRVFLASNQREARASWMRTLPYAPLLDGLFFSCDIGLAKPDPAFFNRVLDAVGASASETLFIDDAPENVVGARSAGLIAEHLSPDRAARGLAEILAAHGVL